MEYLGRKGSQHLQPRLRCNQKYGNKKMEEVFWELSESVRKHPDQLGERAISLCLFPPHTTFLGPSVFPSYRSESDHQHPHHGYSSCSSTRTSTPRQLPCVTSRGDVQKAQKSGRFQENCEPEKSQGTEPRRERTMS